MKRPISFLLLLCLCTGGFAQAEIDSASAVDPYANGTLFQKYNSQQVDFSQHYLHWLEKNANNNSALSKPGQYDFSRVWPTGGYQQNGVLGPNYRRIQVHIDKASKLAKNSTSYTVSGKTMVKGNICDFTGEIKILSAWGYKDCDDTTLKKCGAALASYIFYEDSGQHHTGIFMGFTDFLFYIGKNGTLFLDESMNIADGYRNRTFVGTWTPYHSTEAQKCIWGDYRLPYTFDFDTGDGEMMVNDKYINNGWKTFGTGEEYIPPGADSTSAERWLLKNKWWLTTKK